MSPPSPPPFQGLSNRLASSTMSTSMEVPSMDMLMKNAGPGDNVHAVEVDIERIQQIVQSNGFNQKPMMNNVDKRAVLENLDLIFLCVDEIVDGGIILETEAISAKVAMMGVDADVPLFEQTLTQALARSLLK
ncbi:hypothetical protein L7F22_050916 [Adiantum nelumboides]|nr:hypothetical protein [Adiantum nelumboides]